LFFGRLALLFIEAWVWGHGRTCFSGSSGHAMIAGLLQDTLSIPPALALPAYLIFIFAAGPAGPARLLPRSRAGADRMGGAGLVELFRVLFILLTLYSRVLSAAAKKSQSAGKRFFLHSGFGRLVLHYLQQLLPRLGGDQPDTVSCWINNIRINHRFGGTAQVLELIDRLKPDLVFIQEISGQDRLLFNRRFSASHPHQIWADARENYNGGAIQSKFPFLTARTSTSALNMRKAILI
jgi:hypothetical protein